MTQVVRANNNGHISKYKSKNNQAPRKIKHKFKKSEQPKSNSHTNADVATTKGMRPIMRKSEGNKISFRHCEYRNSDSPVKPDYDGRCHPHWR